MAQALLAGADVLKCINIILHSHPEIEISFKFIPKILMSKVYIFFWATLYIENKAKSLWKCWFLGTDFSRYGSSEKREAYPVKWRYWRWRFLLRDANVTLFSKQCDVAVLLCGSRRCHSLNMVGDTHSQRRLIWNLTFSHAYCDELHKCTQKSGAEFRTQKYASCTVMHHINLASISKFSYSWVTFVLMSRSRQKDFTNVGITYVKATIVYLTLAL